VGALRKQGAPALYLLVGGAPFGTPFGRPFLGVFWLSENMEKVRRKLRRGDF